MYSVEDLLISHGYKLPKHSTASTPIAPPPTSTSCHPPSCLPPSYSKHHEILENKPPPRTLNGYEMGHMVAYGSSSSSSRQLPGYGGGISGCLNMNNVARERTQPPQEGENRSQTDLLTSDSGFGDGTRAAQPQAKNVSYWRRRGQDFTVLLDYAGVQEARGGQQGDYSRPQEAQQARAQELSAEEYQNSIQERRRWAAQAQVQVPAHAQAQARSRKREAAFQQWRMMADRKCQSLGTDVWHPAVNYSHQLSHGEGRHRALEQQRLHAGTPEGILVHPSAKSHSLPRIRQPEGLHYVDITPSGQELYRRFNGHPLLHSDLYRPPYWPENSRPASANQLSIMPKSRFTRPPRPPSYEMHQQIRGSCEILSGRESVLSQVRDRTPLPISRAADPHPMDYYAQDSGPPGYIPPPSYKRAPPLAGRRGYGEILVDYRYRGDMYPQIQVAPDGSHWFSRHPAGSWPAPQRERSTSSQKQHHPMYAAQEHSCGGVQYIPFDDTRVRHISPSLGGSSLTDADKIRQFRNELPCAAVSKPAHSDSAFLPPPLGPFITPRLVNDTNPMSSSSNDNNRCYSNLHKENVDNFPAHDQNCNNRCPPKQCPPLRPSSAFQPTIPRCDFHHGSDPFSAETITHVKQIAPDATSDGYRNAKRRVSETIFCLVSVPVHTPTNTKKDLAADQNNNDTVSNLTISNSAQHFAVCLKESLNIRSKSVNEMPIKSQQSHLYSSSTLSMKNYKRAPLRKEIIEAWARQANEDKALSSSRSWPGNQYRNQETQTGSPITVVKSPEAQSPPGGQDAAQSASDTNTDSGGGLSCSSSYGYPMAGQKNLNPSSNSAFSRLSLTQSSSHQPSTDLSPPSNGNTSPASPGKSDFTSPQNEEQKAFGQFLLKPVNRRPCDAIDVLENINKVMEDAISKRPILRYSLDDIDGMKKRKVLNKSGSQFCILEPGREAISLPPMHTETHNTIKARSKSFNTTADLGPLMGRSAFPAPQSTSIQSEGKDLSACPETSILNKSSVSQDPQLKEADYLSRQGIPVPQESLLRDVGLTVYTETLDGSEEVKYSSHSVSSPHTPKDHIQVKQLSAHARVGFGGSPEPISRREFEAESVRARMNNSDAGAAPSPSTRGTERAGSASISSHLTENSSTLKSQVSFTFENNNGETNHIGSEPLARRNQSEIADQHLEKLLNFDQANALPAEDLSNLYEVKCAEGIPENESIEERAARILGIAVAIDGLGGTDRESDNSARAEGDELPRPTGETTHVMKEYEQVRDGALVVQGGDAEDEELTESVENHKDSHKVESQKQSSVDLDCDDQPHTEPRENLEVPSGELPVSQPDSQGDRTAPNTHNQEQDVQGGESQLTDASQVKDSLSVSSPNTRPDRSTTGGLEALTAVDSDSQTSNVSLEGQADCVGPQGEGQGRETGEKEQMTEGQDNDERDKCLEKCNSEPHNETVHPEDSQREEGDKVGEVIALMRDNQESIGVEGEAKTKNTQRGDLNIGEDQDKPLERGEDEQQAGGAPGAPGRPGAGEGNHPKPKQRTKLQKPPLLPKPRSIPRRDFKRPVGLTAGSCAPPKTEDDKRLSVSDLYDPSQVEQV